MDFCNMQVFLQFLTQNICYLGFFDLTLQMKNKNKLIFKTKIRIWKRKIMNLRLLQAMVRKLN